MAVTVPQNAVVNDPVRAAMSAISAGQDPNAVVYGGESFDSSEQESETPATFDSVESTESIEDSESVEEKIEISASESEPESPSIDKISEPKSDSKSVEEVFVKGADGKRQSIKIDYANKDSIKQAYLKAAGFPILNNRLSTMAKKHAGLEKEHASLKADMDKFESIYQNQGVEGLIRTLGKSEDLDKLIDAKIKHKEYLASLSPEEKYRHDMKLQNEASEKKASEVEAKYKKMMEDIEKKEEQASTRNLEAKLHPAFDRYRFAGKLGDEVVEHQLDETVWTQVTRRLEQYPDDVELTQSIIDKEFRTVAQNLQKVIQVQAEKKVATTIDKKKADAANSAQLVAKKGISTTGEKEKFVESIRNGNIMGAFQAMASGKLKL